MSDRDGSGAPEAPQNGGMVTIPDGFVPMLRAAHDEAVSASKALATLLGQPAIIEAQARADAARARLDTAARRTAASLGIDLARGYELDLDTFTFKERPRA